MNIQQLSHTSLQMHALAVSEGFTAGCMALCCTGHTACYRLAFSANLQKRPRLSSLVEWMSLEWKFVV